MIRLVSKMLAQSISQSCCRTVTQVHQRVSTRLLSNVETPHQSSGEKQIAERLKSNLKVSQIDVKDISGGCGAMYEIYVVAEEFKGKKTVQQHRLVNEILKEEVKGMHGLRIHTDVP